MIDIESRISHRLGQQGAVERIHQLAASLSQRFPQQVHQIQLQVHDHCIDVSFAAYGYVVAWQAEILDEAVVLHGRIPDAARPFRNKIEQAITARVEASLESRESRAA